jgi:transposase InsO family protein
MAEAASASSESVVEEQQMLQSEQKSGHGQSSGAGMTWMSMMAVLAADDTTKPSTANVKVSCTLDRKGGNFRKWITEMVVATINKDCAEAIQRPLPNTRANAAALQLITSSIPEDWEPEGDAKHIAYETLTWVCNKFQGGHDRTINKGWFKQLQEDRMTREENFEQYVTKKYSLYDNLRGNHHSVEHEDLTNAVIDCLPLEFETSKTSLYTQVIGMTKSQMVKHLRIQAYELKFDDLNPRPVPRAAPANPKVFQRPSTAAPDDRRARVRCWECGERGHTRGNCKKWANEAAARHPNGPAAGISGPGIAPACKIPESCAVECAAAKSVPCPMHMRSGDNVEAKVALNIFEHRDAVGQSEEWLIDSGASVHIVNDYTLLQNPTVYSEPRPLQLATEGIQSAITATGSVCIVNSEGKPLWLHNVQYVSNANTNLISVSSGIRDGIKFIPREDTGAYCAMQGPADWECRLHEKHGLYFLRGVYPTRMAVVAQICTVPERAQEKKSEGKHSCRLIRLWHERLGHPGKTASERLTREDLCQGIPVSLIPCPSCETHCDPCVRGKQCRESFPPSNKKSPAVLHRLHADTVAVPTPGDDGERYFITLLDEHSNFVCAIPISSKVNVAAHMIEEIRRWERETGNKVHTIRTDRVTEFLNKTFLAFCAENGIHTEYSAAYTPEQNGRAERMNRTLIEKARTLLLGVEATEELWVDAVLTAVHLHNLMPVTGKTKTPYELFHGSAPDVSYLRKWGCLAYVKHPKHQTSEFGAQSEPGMFVGYCPHTKGYRIRLSDRVVVSPHVHFVEDESGAGILGLGKPYIPMEVREGALHEGVMREESVAREEAMESEESDLEEDHRSPLPMSQDQSLQALVEDMSPISHDATASLPTTESACPDLEHMMMRMQLAARNGGTTTSNISGIRTRAQGALQHLNGALPTVPAAPSSTRTKLQPYCPLTRAQRLEQRNARKEHVETMQSEEIETPYGGSGETDVSAQIVSELGEARVTTEEGSEGPGEVIDILKSARCVIHGVVAECMYESDDDETLANDKYVSPRSRFGQVRCDSTAEISLRNKYEVLQPEEIVSTPDEEEIVDPVAFKGSAAKPQPKKGIRKPVSAEKDIEEIVRELDEEAPMTASMAFMRACLASPAGVKMSKVPVPSNYREARESEQWPFWEQAMVEEKNSLDAHDCFTYVERPRHRKVIPVHWIYSVKVDEHGNVIRYKARLVAQGCRQIDGIDVNEVFAPTSSFGARRVLLSKAAQEDVEIHQVDIKTAFLNGELEEEVYVSQPPGFSNGGTQVCRLNKALYGLKQAPRAWYQKLDATLAKHGYKPCMSDAGIYISERPGEAPMFLVLFVDDMLLICKELDRVLAFKEAIASEFAIHDLGEVKDFLGCQVVRDRPNRRLYMSSTMKIDALVESFGLDGETRKVETPMSKSFVPTAQSVQQNAEEGVGFALEPGHRYCELVGSLLYLANTTRPDIAQAVGVLSRYRGTPTTAHMQEGLRVVRYLKDTRDHALQLGGSDIPIAGFVDADYAGDLDMRASTTGFVFQVYGGSVVWGSKKQTGTATSTVEAEFRAASHAIKEATWLRGFLEEIHVDVWKTPLYCDNAGCIRHLQNPINSKFTKHVAVSFHHARGAVIHGEVEIKFVASQLNLADLFTKPLVPVLFHQHRKTLGVVPRPVL